MKVKERLLELDCLRGIAVLLVITFHFTISEPTLRPFFKFGCTGVDLFFIISGFVIFLTIEKTTHYKDFLISRFSRLYPAFWAGVTLTTLFIIAWAFVLKSYHTIPSPAVFLGNLTMVPAYFNVRYIDGVYWTLVVELLFYLFILIVFLTKKLENIELICFIVLLFSLINDTVFKSQMPVIHNFLMRWLPLLIYFPLFAAGIVFYKIKFYKITVYRCMLIHFV